MVNKILKFMFTPLTNKQVKHIDNLSFYSGIVILLFGLALHIGVMILLGGLSMMISVIEQITYRDTNKR